ncbi:hypothetical protein PE066_19135 [Ramlibacter tataouinensis]|uniref:hypothetical protein n=1 Tax=Ramlibacter tataouinensis TaxID=94132 RepID=UPI0022F3DB37|nr:hypothetical protein [Ramlibacter tataouinensis]WBY01551.1 hypothetical protein PE066_19135 [Ramlibacter tataouinensis]
MAAAAAALVAACGGGGGGGTAVPAVAGSAVGVLTDSPIGGVEYITSGGYRGFTDANGNYNYNEGETVEFRIGGISLGTVTATGTVTPIQLAGSGAGAANKVINLLVLLQSLDADGNPANGITIAETARTAAASVTTLDLTAAPATFASASTLGTLLSSSGVSSTPVTAETALEHFRTQFMSQLAGGWVHASDTKLIVLRFAADGSYLHGENAAPVGDGHPGVEEGKIAWDPVTGEMRVVSTGVDTNGDWGLSSLTGKEIASFNGDKLVFTDPDGTVTTFVRIPKSDTNPLAGMWTLASTGTDLTRQNFVFFASGAYMMLDPVGDDQNAGTPCGGPGIERGTYTYDASTGAFATTAVARDTNGCAGLWDSEAGTGTSVTVPATQIATGIFDIESGVTFRRVGP